jgi:hypothetical protein
MAINFRKAICKLLKKGSALYGLFDCQRYEPPVPPVDPWVEVPVCVVTAKSPNPYCPQLGTMNIPQSQLPIPVCDLHVKPEDPLVKIVVCAETGMLAVPRCVDNKVIEVPLSTLPRPTCTLHVEPKVKVWLGIYDFLGAIGDWFATLKTAFKKGLHGARIFICYSWKGIQTGESPYVKVGEWTHDSGRVFPLYRLGTPDAPSWNQKFWDHFVEVLATMRDRGLTAWLVAEDFCSLKGDQTEKYWNPFYSSEEALGPTTPGGVWGDSMKVYHLALFQKIIETANAIGVDYIFEVMNESDIVRDENESDESLEARVIAWNKWAHEAIIGLGFPKARLIASPGRGAEEIAKQVGRYSPHGIGKPEQIRSYYSIPIEATVFSSDGVWDGTGPADANGRHGVGLDVAGEIGIAIFNLGGDGFELLFRDAYALNNDQANFENLDWSIGRAMAYLEE